nr:MAG TPA: conotoxin [Caudoviricetes sp.]
MCQHKKCRKYYCASYIFHIFAFEERKLPSRHFRI